MCYRIHYGNGQVSRTFHSYASVRAELVSLRGTQYAHLYRIQRHDGEDWIGLGKAGRLATAELEGL